MEAAPPQIRRATEDDLGAITAIYNEAIETTTATFDTETKSIDDRRRWFRAHGEKHPVLVTELDGQVTGWASLTAWSERCAYDTTAEVSLYIDSRFRNRGLGKALLKKLVEEADGIGMHSLLARIVEGNPQSIGLHERFGFRTVGVMHEVGFKFGRFLDVTLMERVRTGEPAKQ